MKKVVHLAFLVILSLVLSLSSCGDDDGDSAPLPDVEGPDLSQTVIWSGAALTFEKTIGSDPSLAENQDRITDNVWITRANGAGQIYNAVTENSANKDLSPAGTLWAIGTTANLQNLDFDRFRAALGKPKDRVGVDLVMLLVEDNIAIDVKFTSWSQQQVGGFRYERSTAP